MKVGCVGGGGEGPPCKQNTKEIEDRRIVLTPSMTLTVSVMIHGVRVE